MKIAIFHLGRCGSTVLASMLNDGGHDLIHLGDPFTDNKDKDTIEYLKEFTESDKENVIFDCKPYKFEALGPGRGINMSFDDFVKGLKEEVGVDKIVLLKRNNYLRRTISGMVAERSGIYHHIGPSTIQNNPVSIELDTLYWFVSSEFKEIDDWYENVEELSDMVITYEDNIQNDPKDAYRKMCEFMGLAPNPKVDTHYKKTNPLPASVMIKNQDDLQKAFGGTEYEWMIYK